MTKNGWDCMKFGEQMNCSEPEPVDCDMFSLCEFITWQREKKVRLSGESVNE